METSVKTKPEFVSVKTNGIQLRVALAGKGPLVVLVHGWPESWYSWRHQIPALAQAGYRVAAPDVRRHRRPDRGPRRARGHSDRPRLGRADRLEHVAFPSTEGSGGRRIERPVYRTGACPAHPT